jgi:thioredoxin 1
MKQLTIQEMETLVSEGGDYLVDFYADWCGPCRAMAPTLKEISEEEKINVIKIDVDKEERDLLSKFNISSIPTIIAYKNGKAVNRATGAQNKIKLLQMLS